MRRRLWLYENEMEELAPPPPPPLGALGTSSSLALRLGQTIFSIASLLFMCLGVDFYSYTAFCFVVAIMGLMIPWSLTLAIMDTLSVLFKRPSRLPGTMLMIVIGDWVLSLLSLAAACSTASVTEFMIAHTNLCDRKLCTRYQLCSAMTFLSWFLILASFFFNLWLLPSL